MHLNWILPISLSVSSLQSRIAHHSIFSLNSMCPPGGAHVLLPWAFARFIISIISSLYTNTPTPTLLTLSLISLIISICYSYWLPSQEKPMLFSRLTRLLYLQANRRNHRTLNRNCIRHLLQPELVPAIPSQVDVTKYYENQLQGLLQAYPQK